MDIEKNKNSAIVGIFIFLGIVIFIGGLLIVGGKGSLFAKTIAISANFENVNGLVKGNNVWFSGVKVGTVKKVTFNANESVTVEMVIEENSVPYIHKDAKAKMSTDGLVGNKIVVLEGGSAGAPVISSGDVLAVAKPVDTEEMMATLQENNKNLVEITKNFKVISKGMAEGQGTIGKLLTDDKLFTDLGATIAVLKNASDNTNRLTANLSAYSAGFNRKGTFANDLITDTAIFSNIRSAVRQIQAVSVNANSVAENLKEASAGLNTEGSAANVLLHDAPTAESVKTMISNLETSSVKLNETMDALQHSFLLRGYFRKKEKEAKK